MTKIHFIANIYDKAILAFPWILMGSIIDYRFLFFYWHIKRTFPSYQFDFWSIFPFYTFLLIGLKLLVSLKNWKEEQKRLHDFFQNVYLLIPLVFILGGIFISFIFWETYPPIIRSWFGSIRINYVVPILTALLVIEQVRDKPHKESFLKQSFYAINTLGVACLTQYALGIFPGAQVDYLQRLVWPYVDPFTLKAESANFLSYVFAPFLILSSSQLIQQFQNKKCPITEIVTILITLSVLILSKSYTGIIIVFCLLCIMVFRSIHSSKKYILLGVVSLLFASIAGFQLQSKKFEILMNKTTTENSLDRRSTIYAFTWEAMKKHLLRGIGPGQYQSYFRQYQKTYLTTPLIEKEIPPHPHNLILTFWSELGIFGLLSILSLYGLSFYSFFINNKSVALLPMLYFLGHGLLDTPYLLEEINALFWLFFVWSSVEWKLSKKEYS